MCGLLSRPDDVRSNVVDLDIVCPDPLGFGESFAVAFDICALQPNDGDEIMLPSRFVVRDLQEERCDGILKYGEVGVRSFLRDQLKVIDCCREFRDDLIRSHPAPAKMAGPSSQGCVGAGVVGLR